jgi:hypothetical protein
MIVIALPSHGSTRQRRPAAFSFRPWLAVALEGNYFAARMDFRALQPNILQLFAKNTRRFLKI